MIMKQWKVLAAWMLGAAILTGCGASSGDAAKAGDAADAEQTSQASQDALARIKEKGKLVIAMEGNWAPWTYHDGDDTLTGYDVDLGKAIAEHIGVEAEFTEGEWDGLFAGMDNGRYDLVINGVDITEDRKEKYDFSEPYGYIHTVLVTKKGNSEVNSFEDLQGRTTANSIGSTYMELAEQYGATVSGVDTLDETMQMVISGRVDATLNAEVSVQDYLKEHPDAEIQIVDSTEDPTQIAVPMVKGDDTASLREAVDETIAELRESGALAESSNKYFGIDITEQ